MTAGRTARQGDLCLFGPMRRLLVLLAVLLCLGCSSGGGSRLAPAGGGGLINVGGLHRWDGRSYADETLDFRGPQEFYQPREFPTGWTGLP